MKTSPRAVIRPPQESTLEIRNLGIPLHEKGTARRRRRQHVTLTLIGLAALGAMTFFLPFN